MCCKKFSPFSLLAELVQGAKGEKGDAGDDGEDGLNGSGAIVLAGSASSLPDPANWLAGQIAITSDTEDYYVLTINQGIKSWVKQSFNKWVDLQGSAALVQSALSKTGAGAATFACTTPVRLLRNRWHMQAIIQFEADTEANVNTISLSLSSITGLLGPGESLFASPFVALIGDGGGPGYLAMCSAEVNGTTLTLRPAPGASAFPVTAGGAAGLYNIHLNALIV